MGYPARSWTPYALCISLLLLVSLLPPVAGDGMLAYRPEDVDDPVVPVHIASYFGGSESDFITDIEVIDSRLYLCGFTESNDIPTTGGVLKETQNGSDIDAFITVFDMVTGRLLHSTYLGGSGDDQAYGLAIDANESIIVIGTTTSLDFPTTSNAFKKMGDGLSDAFICVIDTDLSQLEFSTYLGGDSYDACGDVDLDPEGCIYLVGSTISKDFPTTVGAVQESSPSGIDVGDGFICKIDPYCPSLVFSSFLSGGSGASPVAIVVDEVGAPYIGGLTSSNDFPVTPYAFQRTINGPLDGFVCKLENDGSKFNYGSFIGGSDDDGESELVYDIELDENGNAVIVGHTTSWDFPVTDDAYRQAYNGSKYEGFVSKINANGSSLLYSSFIGGSSTDVCYSVTLGDDGGIIVTGFTGSNDFPITNGSFDDTISAMGDVFLSRFSPDGSKLTYSTYIGGTGYEIPYGIHVNTDGNVTIAGLTTSDDFYVTKNTFQSDFAGGISDGFFIELPTKEEPPTAEAGQNVIWIDQNETVYFDGSASTDNFGILNWSWNLVYGASLFEFNTTSFSFTFDAAGVYTAVLTVVDEMGYSDTDTVRVYVRDITRPHANAGIGQTIDEHERVMLNGTASSDNVGITNWTWTFKYNGNVIILKGPVQNFTFDVVGTYEVEMNVTDAAGNWDRDTITIEVLDITGPSADAGPDQIVDQHTTVHFSGLGSHDNVGVVNWTWSFSYDLMEVLLYGSTPEFTFDDAGTYRVTLVVVDSSGLTGTDTMDVIAKDTTPPHADSGDDQFVDQHTLVTFDSTGSFDNVKISNLTWRFHYLGEEHVFYGPSPSFLFDDVGVYSIGLFVADTSNLSAIDFFNVFVRDVTPPVAVAGDAITIDQNTYAEFDGTGSSDNVAIINWTWTFVYRGENISIFGKRPNFLFKVPGSFTVMLTVSDEVGLSDSDIIDVHVSDTIHPVAVISLNRNITVGDVIHIHGNDSYDNTEIIEWKWDIEIGGNIWHLWGPEVTFIFPIEGLYNISLTVEDPEGLTDEEIISVRAVTEVIEPEPTDGDGGIGTWVYYVVALIVVASILVLLIGWKGGYFDLE